MKLSLHDWKEAQRLQAWRLQQQGWSQRQIAKALGISEGAVSQWITRARAGGAEALRHRPLPGAPRQLSPEQLAQLPAILQRGPERLMAARNSSGPTGREGRGLSMRPTSLSS
jgi:transposase